MILNRNREEMIMITALTIKEELPKGLWRKIGAFLSPIPPVSTLRTMGDTLAVLHVEYERKREKIAWDKIEKELGNGKKEVLYSGDIPLPKGLKRYRSHALMHRLAENAALEVLTRLKLPPYRLRLGLFDPDGANDGMLRLLLPFSSCINAVSGNMKTYIDRADEIMEESGAFISVHKSIGCLQSCHVVIAPEKIRMELPLSDSAIVFTGEKPAVSLRGVVFDSYALTLPQKYDPLRPDSISSEYFACALYDKGRQHELGSLIPQGCVCAGQAMRMDDVCRFVKVNCEAI